MIAAYMVKKPSRRIARMELDCDRFVELLRSMDGTRTFKVEGIPDDARCVGWHQAVGLPTLWVYVESGSFKEVPDGALAPRFDPTWTEIVPARTGQENQC